MHAHEKRETSQTCSGQKHEKVVSKEQACSFLCFPQDQVVLGMLRLFNSIWAREGVMHTLPGGGQVAVHAPLYRCMTCSISSGFVEMLPRSTPVEDIPVAKTRADNGWRCSNDLIPTAVAGFISTWVLDLRDRHQGNMVLTETGSGPAPVSFANIDFGWVEEGPPLDTGAFLTTPVSCFGAMFYRKESTAGIHQDQLGTKRKPSFVVAHKTGRFPIPKGLRYLLESSKLKAEFFDLSWDALRVLHEHRVEIRERWCSMLTDRGLNDRVLYSEVPERVRGRLNLPREALDKELGGTRKGKMATGLKNATHNLHAKMK